MFTDRREHFTKLCNVARDHIDWMQKFGFKSSQHFYDLQRENLHNLMHRDCQPLY